MAPILHAAVAPKEQQQDWLLSPAAFGAAGRGGVAVVQTHISHLYLVGDGVYKLKKPIRLSFLDYSTVEQRRDACLAEVRLNGRLCPWLYLGVTPVVEDRDGQRRIGSSGEVDQAADWAVHMRRLPHDDMLHVRLARRRVDRQSLIEIARLIASFHRSAALDHATAERYAGAGAIERLFREIIRALRTHATDPIFQEQLGRIQHDVEIALYAYKPLFEQRVADRQIVEGHGDLRPENICLTQPLTVFDCLEYSAALRYGDVLNDIAYLAVSLEASGREDLKRAFLDAYFAEAPLALSEELLKVYQVYRALVLARRVFLQATNIDTGSSSFNETLQRAQSYLDLALRFTSETLGEAPGSG